MNMGSKMQSKKSAKVALITGITGQDGSYLAELLISKGYEVHGIIRRHSLFNAGRIKHLLGESEGLSSGQIILHFGDLTDSTSLLKIVLKVRPDEIYNLGAQSEVKTSYDIAEYTLDVDAIGALRLLEAIKICGIEKHVRFYQASTSEMFGRAKETPLKETTPFSPRSPYGAAKLCAHWAIVNYREAFGIFACSGILCNHESPRRGEGFVTRKISKSVAKIHLGLLDKIELGNLDSERDWGHAKDYVEAMWMMLQAETPDDFLISTGKTHSVRDFVEIAFKEIGKEILWTGSGVNEVGKEKNTGIIRVTVNPDFYRPGVTADVVQGDSTKARTKLGWQPKSSFNDLVRDMVKCDIEILT